MGLVERLLEKEATKAKRQQELKTQQEARERERLQRAAAENERRAKRKQQAERFREESGVGLKVEELVKFFETPTIPGDGFHTSWTEYVRRGSSGISSTDTDGFPFRQRDLDSTFDIVHWDTKDLGYSKARVMGSDSHHSEKYIAVETCPDGTIVFHAGWFGGTTLRVSEWRIKDREQIFDKALEKAYENPGVNKYSVWHQPQNLTGFG